MSGSATRSIVEEALYALGWSDAEILRGQSVHVIDTPGDRPVQREVDLLLQYAEDSPGVPVAVISTRRVSRKEANSAALWGRAPYLAYAHAGVLRLYETRLHWDVATSPLASAQLDTASIEREFRPYLLRDRVRERLLEDVTAGRVQLRLPGSEEYLASATAQSLAANIRRYATPISDFYRDEGVPDPVEAAFRTILLIVVSRVLVDQHKLPPADEQDLLDALNESSLSDVGRVLGPAQAFLCDANASYLGEIPKTLPPGKSIGAFSDALSSYTFGDMDASLLGTLYEALVESPQAQAQGRFYTQPAVTKLVFKAIEPPSSRVRTVGIADLSCGSGSFLVAGSDWLREHCLTGRLLGKDLSDTAVALARLTLHLLRPDSAEKADLLQGNGLIPKDGPTYSDIHIVVGNPPFGSYPKDADPKEIRQLAEDYRFFQNRKERSLLFVEQALSIVPEGGWIGMVLPESKLMNPAGSAFRRALLDSCLIRRIAFLPMRAFKSKYPTAVVVAQRESDAERREDNLVAFTRFDVNADLGELETGDLAVHNEVRQGVWAARPETAPPVFAGTPVGHFVEHLGDGTVPLGALATMGQGVQFTGGKPHPNREPVFQRWLTDGRAVRSYWIDTSALERIPPKQQLRRATDRRLFERPRLILQRLRNPTLRQRLVVGLELSKSYYTQSNIINIRLLEANVPTTYVSALLNSNLINLWYGVTYYGHYLNLKHLRTIPIRLTDRGIERDVDRLVRGAGDQDSSERSRADAQQKLDQLVYDIYGIVSKARDATDAYIGGQSTLRELFDGFPEEWRQFPTAGRGLFGYQGIAGSE